MSYLARPPCLPADPQQLSPAHPSPFHGHKGGLWDSDGGHLSEVPENEVLTTPLASGSSSDIDEEISDYSQYNDADEVRPWARDVGLSCPLVSFWVLISHTGSCIAA